MNVQVMEKLPTFAPHMEAVELTNALWACGKLEVTHDGVFEQLIPILIKLCAAQVPPSHLSSEHCRPKGPAPWQCEHALPYVLDCSSYTVARQGIWQALATSTSSIPLQRDRCCPQGEDRV